MPESSPHELIHSHWIERALGGAHLRAPDGRRLTKKERACLDLVDAINAPVIAAAEAAGKVASSRDVMWLLNQFCEPLAAASRKGVKLPDVDLLMRTVARIEDLRAGVDISSRAARSRPHAKLRRALENWVDAVYARRKDPRWAHVEGTPVTLARARQWRIASATTPLDVIDSLDVSPEFLRALSMVVEWDEFLSQRGRQCGEPFSLRREVLRLNNWPGDQWKDGDDFAAAQERFHRRLRKARAASSDPLRDRVMERALFLREGLLLGPVDDVDWFLAVCNFRRTVPEALDVRVKVGAWRLFEMFSPRRVPIPTGADTEVPEWVCLADDPREVPSQFLTAVSGPPLMIDLDEDVVAALPPGCSVRRLFLSGRGALGPDWAVYWVESEWKDSRPFLDLVESAKLHPRVLFVSNAHPSDLAHVVAPFLDCAFTIPTHELSAHSRLCSHDFFAGSLLPASDERFDAAL